MNYRTLGSTGLKVSEVSFGTWAIGGAWGRVNDAESRKAIERAIDAGVNFFDTADVYGDGHSEELLAELTADKKDSIYVATKFCRAGNVYDPATYSQQSVRGYCEASLRRLKREIIDLYQVHCPPLEILKQGDVFTVLDQLKQEGKIRHYGVSVETVEEGLFCLTQPNVQALQVIYNLFRQKPDDQLFPEAKSKGVGILVRLPLASGLLTGKFTKESSFEKDDHRNFNANGESFNVGETFAGLEFAYGVELSEQLSWIAEGRGNMTRSALRWILDNPNISCVIPGFKSVAQVEDNLQAIDVPSFTPAEKERITEFYRNQVHHAIRGAY